MIARMICIVLFILVNSLILKSQVTSDTLFFNKVEIRVYSYMINGITIDKAYYDQSIPQITKLVNTNIGIVNKNITFDSIAVFVRSKSPVASITATDLNVGEFPPFNKDKLPNSHSAIINDHYNFSAVNYYEEKIEEEPLNYLYYYKLAQAYELLQLHYFLSSESVLIHLDKCIAINPNFGDAYLLKAKIYERSAEFNGALISDPHVGIVAIDEIQMAIDCLNDLLKINPNHKKANDFLTELKKKYGEKLNK